jgi:hypothetical protein
LLYSSHIEGVVTGAVGVTTNVSLFSHAAFTQCNRFWVMFEQFEYFEE